MVKQERSDGFATILTIVVLVIVVIGFGGWYIWHFNHKNPEPSTITTSNHQIQTKQGGITQTTDPYAGWKTYCDPAINACYKYPSDWVASQYGGYQNSTDTGYFKYQSLDNKDQAANDVYIVRIEDLSNNTQGLKIIGFVFNNVPTYVVYDSSIVTNANLHTGQTARIVTANPTFEGKSGRDNVTFIATPGAKGIANIANEQQAIAWFDKAEAKTCLEVLQSFYYQ